MTSPALWPRPAGEIQFETLTSGGPGGQNVNRVATAVRLRFDVKASTLPEKIKERLLARRDRRVTEAGIVLIHSSEHRSQERNRTAALGRLHELILNAGTPPRPRKATRPGRAAKRRRLEDKKKRGRIKASRGRVTVTE